MGERKKAPFVLRYKEGNFLLEKTKRRDNRYLVLGAASMQIPDTLTSGK